MHPHLGLSVGPLVSALRPNAREASIEFVPLSPDRIAPYQTFAREQFGPASYQAQRNYLRWMYEEAPHTTGYGEAKLAVVGERVVGCFHKMHLPWTWGGKTELVASPHNLVVDPRFRTGVGLGLITETFRGEKHQLLMGAGSSVDRIYERLGARALTSCWLRTLLNPLTAPAVAALHRAAPIAMDAVLARAHAVMGHVRVPARWVEVRSSFDDEIASDATHMLLRHSGSAAHVHWTPELVQWRFFSKIGPRHLLVCLGPSRDARAFAIVSLGVHHALALARTVEWHAESERWSLLLGIVVRALLSVLGANAWFAMTSDPARAASWRRLGFWDAREPPKIYELHSPRTASFGATSFGGSAGDYGFEAMALDRT
jgi:hypothetical protein